MSLSDTDVAFFLEPSGGSVAALSRDRGDADRCPREISRTPGYRPQARRNKYNAWYYKSEVKGRRLRQAAGQAQIA